MFNVGAGEMLVIMLLALIVLGPERLPKAMGQVGRAVAQLRRISGGFQDEIRRAMDPDNAPFRPGEQTLRGPVPAIEDEVKVVNADDDSGSGEEATADDDARTGASGDAAATDGPGADEVVAKDVAKDEDTGAEAPEEADAAAVDESDGGGDLRVAG